MGMRNEARPFPRMEHSAWTQPQCRKDGFWWASRPFGLYPNPMRMDQQKDNQGMQTSYSGGDSWLAACIWHMSYFIRALKKPLPFLQHPQHKLVNCSQICSLQASGMKSLLSVCCKALSKPTNSTYKIHDSFKGPLQKQDKHLRTSWCLRLENHVSGSSLAQAEPASPKGCAATGLPKWSTATPAQHFSKQGKSNQTPLDAQINAEWSVWHH